MEKNQFHVTMTTSKEVEQVIADLETSLKEIQFGVLWKFDIHKKLEEKKIPFNKKITILEVCNPEEAHGILDIEPMASYFLPCKIVISVDNSTTTKIGLVRPSLLIGLMEDEELNKVAEIIEGKLISAMEKAI